MFTYFKIALTLLQITRSIISYLERQSAISEGQQMILALELQKTLAAAKVAKEVQTKVDGMSDDEVDAALNGDYRP